MIRFHAVTYAYEPGHPVLEQAELTVPAGLTLLLGPNGCGKSTLLRLAAGVEAPDEGRVEIDGIDLWSEEVSARRRLAYLPERPDLTPYANLGEILDLVCRLRGVGRSEGRSALTRVGLGEHATRSVRELSQGQRRRALLAAALVATPANVLLDEPLATMDRGGRQDLLDWTDELVAAGTTVLLVSHNFEPFVDRAGGALTISGRQCSPRYELPSGTKERRSLLERLARGGPLGGDDS